MDEIRSVAMGLTENRSTQVEPGGTRWSPWVIGSAHPLLIDDESSAEPSPGFPITSNSSLRGRRRVTSVGRRKQANPPLLEILDQPLSDPIDVEGGRGCGAETEVGVSI